MKKFLITGAALVALAVPGAGAYVALNTDTAEAETDSALTTKGFGPSALEPVGTDFYNVETLQEDVLTTYNNTPPVEHKAQVASCIRIGRKATCLVRTHTVNIPVNVVISPEGRSYIAIAQP